MTSAAQTLDLAHTQLLPCNSAVAPVVVVVGQLAGAVAEEPFGFTHQRINS